jgi:hypothetical protein
LQNSRVIPPISRLQSASYLAILSHHHVSADDGLQNENALFREMVSEFTPPSWAKLVIVSGDAAYGSKANMKMVKDRDQADEDRRWGFVFAIARTWKTVDEKMIKNLVTHLPRHLY